jgi:hypothetical protein
LFTLTLPRHPLGAPAEDLTDVGRTDAPPRTDASAPVPHRTRATSR